MKSISGSFDDLGLAVVELERALDRGAHHLLGWDAVGRLGPGPHEIDPAARHDEGLEAVPAQVGQQLDHRLVDQPGIGPVEARVAGGGQPVGDLGGKGFGGDAGVRRHDDLDDALLAGGRERRLVAVQRRLERLGVAPFGMLRRQRLEPVEREHALGVDRLLDPERAVIVEHGDPLGLRHEVGAALRRDRGNEIDDRRLRRAVVPGRQISCAGRMPEADDQHGRQATDGSSSSILPIALLDGPARSDTEGLSRWPHATRRGCNGL